MWILGIGLVSLVAGLFFARLVSRAAEETTFDPRLMKGSELMELDAAQHPTVEPARGRVTPKVADRMTRPAAERPRHDRIAAQETASRLEKKPEEVHLNAHLNN